MIRTKETLLGIFILIILSNPLFAFQEHEDNILVDKTSFWYSLINLPEEETIKKLKPLFGSSFVDISPKEISSKADRVLWYKNGPTLWYVSKKLIQLRLTSQIKGDFKGISMGCSAENVRDILGEPWIERKDSLYYNLPWRGGPIRLRLIFVNDKLNEAYLYNLNYTINKDEHDLP